MIFMNSDNNGILLERYSGKGINNRIKIDRLIEQNLNDFFKF